jgi:scavenger receptor class B, member 1
MVYYELVVYNFTYFVFYFYFLREKWEKVNIVKNDNGTISFNQKKVYTFSEEDSAGQEDDVSVTTTLNNFSLYLRILVSVNYESNLISSLKVVIVPNIPMLSATSQSKHAARFLRLAMASIMDILKIKPFVEVTVGQLLWGYEDPLLKLAKDVVPKEQKLPYDEFGLL